MRPASSTACASDGSARRSSRPGQARGSRFPSCPPHCCSNSTSCPALPCSDLHCTAGASEQPFFLLPPAPTSYPPTYTLTPAFTPTTSPTHLGPQQPGAPLNAALDEHLQRGRGAGAHQTEAVGQLLSPAAAACKTKPYNRGQRAGKGTGTRCDASAPSLGRCDGVLLFSWGAENERKLASLAPPRLRRAPPTPSLPHLSTPRSARRASAPPTRSPRDRS